MLRHGVYTEQPGQDLLWPLTLTVFSLKEVTPELGKKGWLGRKKLGYWYDTVSVVSVTWDGL